MERKRAWVSMEMEEEVEGLLMVPSIFQIDGVRIIVT